MLVNQKTYCLQIKLALKGSSTNIVSSLSGLVEILDILAPIKSSKA